MAKAVMSGRYVVVVSGFYGPKSGVVDAAWAMQQHAARAYEGSETGAGPLRANSLRYTTRKIMDGLDPRRGHRTGALQAAMYDVQCFSVRGDASSGVWRIEFSDRPLIRALGDYVEYFAQAKARGGRVLAMNRRFVDAGMAVLSGIQRRDPMTALAPQPRSRRELERVASSAAVRARTTVRKGIGRTGVRVA